MNAQAGLRLCCSQTSEERFSRVEAHSFKPSELANKIALKSTEIVQSMSSIGVILRNPDFVLEDMQTTNAHACLSKFPF